MLKRMMTACLLVLSLTAQSAFAAADIKTVSLASGYDEIEITADNDETQGFITVYVYAENGTKLVFMDQQRRKNENTFAFKFKPESERFEKYTVQINRNGEIESVDFKYYTYSEQQQAIAELLSGTEITDELAEKLSLDISEKSLYGKLENQAEVLTEMKAVDSSASITPETVADAFAQSVVKAALKSENPSTLKMLAEEYKDITKLEESYSKELSWYGEIEDNSEFWNRMAEKTYENSDEYGTEFAAQAFLYKVSLTPYSELEEFIKESNGKYTQNGLTLNVDFDSLGLKTQAELDKAMYKIADELYDDIADLEEAIDDAADEVIKERGSGSTGGAGSSSGSSSGNVKSDSGSSSGTSTSTYIKPPVISGNKISFGDLENVAWAKEAIIALAEKGIVNGMGGNIYEPETLVTREQFAKMAALAFGFKANGKMPEFADTDKEAWYMEYVAACCENGIMIGTGSRFGIGEAVSRQDIAVVLHRIMSKRGISGSLENNIFGDSANIAAYAKDSVNYLYNKGIIKGTGENKISPEKFADRAETAKLIYDTLKFMGE